jgi:hypothetical protein
MLLEELAMDVCGLAGEEWLDVERVRGREPDRAPVRERARRCRGCP